MELILFDLDDTLYPEIDYVKSGFWNTSKFLNYKLNRKGNDIFNRILQIFNDYGRGKIFDLILNELGIFSNEMLRLLIYIYRNHKPKIKLYKSCIEIMESLKKKGIKLCIITNGKASIQKNKIDALKIEKYIDLIIYADDIGNNREFWKPSEIPYKMALEFFNTSSSQTIFIGDDPATDFPGAKSCGIKTVLVNGKSPLADYLISELGELPTLLEDISDEREKVY